MNKHIQHLAGLKTKELFEKFDEYKRELFTLKLSSSTSYVKDNSQFKKLKKNIARTLTLIRMRKHEMEEA
jgi:ribosomal protein L29